MKRISVLLCASILLLSCEKSDSVNTARTGTGGSLARFTIVGQNLYIADWSTVTVYDISDAANPVYRSSVGVRFNVETIFPHDDKIFIGSNQGMFVYSIGAHGDLEKIGRLFIFEVVTCCRQQQYAYVTLRAGTACGVGVSGLYIYDITTIDAPQQQSLLEMSEPSGLGLKDSVVFVCTDTALNIVNVRDAAHPHIMRVITGAQYRDVIPLDDLLICYVASGLLLYDISNLNDIKRVGEVKYL